LCIKMAERRGCDVTCKRSPLPTLVPQGYSAFFVSILSG